MSDSISGVSTIKTSDETHSLTEQERGDVDIASSSHSTPVTSEDVARQMKAVTDLLAKQLERLCDLMNELQ